MSNSNKNKISYNHVFIIAVIANFLLFYFIFKLIGTENPAKSNDYNQYIIELSKSAQDSDTNLIQKELKKSDLVDVQSIEFISKNKALSYFGEEIKGELTEKIKQENPFNDLLIFSLSESVSKSVKDSFLVPFKINPIVASINDISPKKGSILSSGSASGVGSKIFYGLSIVLILYVLSIGLSMDFVRNKDSLIALIKNGKDPSDLKRNYQKKGVMLGLKTWIIGVFLFILTFYLIKTAFGVEIIKFGFQNLVIVSVSTLALVIFTLQMVIAKKVDNLQNEQ